jgi:hypothetical protein
LEQPEMLVYEIEGDEVANTLTMPKLSPRSVTLLDGAIVVLAILRNCGVGGAGSACTSHSPHIG